jgi:phage protein D
MSGQPDFIITIGGQDITRYCQEWTFTDDEEGQSEIDVQLGNPDMRLSGAFDYGDDLQIRFGYDGQLGGAAYLPVAEVKERYPTGKELTIHVIGRDESNKMSGGKEKGVKGKKGDKDEDVIGRVAKEQGVKIATEEFEGTKHKKPYVMNENPREVAAKYARNGKSKKSGGGSSPKSPFDGKKGGYRFSSAERIPEEGEDRDKHRGTNHSNQNKNEPITGTLQLKGYPTLRAKGNVAVQGFGSKASGTYYVKKVKHSWGASKGFLSDADLVRGGSGKGDAGGDPPIVMYADIWKKGEIYLGPRKMDGQPQATFTYGDAKHLIEFTYHLKPQLNRHAGEGSEGEGLDLRDKGEAYKAEYEKGKQAAEQESK